MTQTNYTGFGGAAGRVYRESFSAGALLSGLVLGILFFAVLRLFDGERSVVMAGPLIQVLWALALVRFALNGASGQWSGTLFSTQGGPWSYAGTVLLRYLALAAMWVVPMALILGGDRGSDVSTGLIFGMADPKWTTLLLLYAAATVLTPPVFLIIAVSAERFGDIVSRAHWSRVLSGRTGDLALIYALYLGAVLGVLILLLPLCSALFPMSRGFALFVGGTGLVFVLGLAADLLGRLCGFFAGMDPSLIETEPEAVHRSPGPSRTAPAGNDEDHADRESLYEAELRAAGRPNLTLVAHAPNTPSGKPPLLDARERVEEHVRRFDQNPQGVIDGLVELNRDYAENPLVLHALCLLRRRAGDVDGAVATAIEALPLFFQRGNYRLAAEVFHTLIDRAEELDAGRDQILEIAQQLIGLKLFASASRACRILIARDAFDTRAIKTMLRLGEVYLHQTGEPKEAEAIYRFLVEHCSASPLAEYMRQGLEEAERRAAQA